MNYPPTVLDAAAVLGALVGFLFILFIVAVAACIVLRLLLGIWVYIRVPKEVRQQWKKDT